MTRALTVQRLTWRALVAGLMAMAVWLVLALPGLAQPAFPELTGRVVDQADLLSAAKEAELETRLAALERDTSDQLVVVTVRTLDGYDIADYGTQLGRHWQIGQKDGDNGVLLIVALEERKIRIEVGYGLEGILTDALSALIIHEQITPAFKVGGFERGIEQGVVAIEQQLRLDPEEAMARAAEVEAARADVPVGALIIIALVFGFILIAIVGALSQGGRRRRGGSDIAPILIWAASEALRSRGGGGGGGGFGGGGFGGGGGSFGGGGASGGW
ncbi:MAG: TPM domain-containing protein [Brevundimonas sp.]|uniref:TPM domain-containing protein n=1 Tax=Brevundimonas sp. TaxID=1871086 RepID=UPI00274AC903|nr:TPM domain-containing protein [Brevundimonas sp.]MDP3401397.1 TPM domain-containing protein [Brevundimonas sp.]MDZ4112448.1 TPM domain-containing protein [Brevundimonas sp.]